MGGKDLTFRLVEYLFLVHKHTISIISFHSYKALFSLLLEKYLLHLVCLDIFYSIFKAQIKCHFSVAFTDKFRLNYLPFPLCSYSSVFISFFLRAFITL